MSLELKTATVTNKDRWKKALPAALAALLFIPIPVFAVTMIGSVGAPSSPFTSLSADVLQKFEAPKEEQTNAAPAPRKFSIAEEHLLAEADLPAIGHPVLFSNYREQAAATPQVNGVQGGYANPATTTGPTIIEFPQPRTVQPTADEPLALHFVVPTVGGIPQAATTPTVRFTPTASTIQTFQVGSFGTSGIPGAGGVATSLVEAPTNNTPGTTTSNGTGLIIIVY